MGPSEGGKRCCIRPLESIYLEQLSEFIKEFYIHRIVFLNLHFGMKRSIEDNLESIRWEWKSDTGKWRPFDEAEQLESAYQSGARLLDIGHRTIDLVSMTQKNSLTGGIRKVRRHTVISSSLKKFDGKSIFLNKLKQQSNDEPNEITIDDILRSSEPLESGLLSSFGFDLEWLTRHIPHYVKEILLLDHWNEPRPPPCHSSSSLSPGTSFKFLFPPFPRSPQYSHGSMHAKLMILVFESFVRIVVSSANLTSLDWEEVGQAIWVVDCPKNSGEEGTACKSNTSNGIEFQKDLLKFVDQLLLGSPDTSHWRDLISDTIDFSGVRAKLVTSVPGSFRGPEMTDYGHLRIRSILQSEGLKGTVSFKASSVGLAPRKWLNELAESFGADGIGAFRYHWPTFSVGSKLSGKGILHYQGRQWPEIANIFSPWKAGSSARESFACHSKTFVGRSTGPGSRVWVYLGSHNLSQPAWGSFTQSGEVLQICSYELGVLLFDLKNPLLTFDPEHRPWPHGELPWIKEVFSALVFYRKGHESKIPPGDTAINIKTTVSKYLQGYDFDFERESMFGDFCAARNGAPFMVLIFGCSDGDPNNLAGEYVLKTLHPELNVPLFPFMNPNKDEHHLSAVRHLFGPLTFPFMALASWRHGRLAMLYRAEGIEEILSVGPEDLKQIQAEVVDSDNDTIAQIELEDHVKLICLDIDGTIVPDQKAVKLLPDAAEFIKSLDPEK